MGLPMEKSPGAFMRQRHEWEIRGEGCVQLDIERIISANSGTDIGTSTGMGLN